MAEDDDFDIDSLDLDSMDPDLDGLGDTNLDLDSFGDDESVDLAGAEEDSLAGEDFNFEGASEDSINVDELDFQDEISIDSLGKEDSQADDELDLNSDLESLDGDNFSLDDVEEYDLGSIEESETSISEDDFDLESLENDTFDLNSKDNETSLDNDMSEEATGEDEVMELLPEDQEPLQFDVAGEADELEDGFDAEEIVDESDAFNDDETLVLSDEEVADDNLNDETLGSDLSLDNFEEESFNTDFSEPDQLTMEELEPQNAGLLDLDSPFDEFSHDELGIDAHDEPEDIALTQNELAAESTPVASMANSMAIQEQTEQKIAPDLLLNLNHEVSIEVGKTILKGSEIANLEYGSVLLLDKEAGETVDLTLNGQTLAHGEVVLINNVRLGVRIIGLNAG